METLLITSTIIFLIYNISIISKFGIPSSLSETFYLLENKKRNLGYLFTIVLYAMSFTLVPVWLELTVGQNIEFLKFFCAAMLAFVGAAPLFKTIDKVPHMVFAGISAIAGLLWVLIATPYWYLVLIVLLSLLLIMFLTKTKKCITYWLEMVMFITIYIVNYIYLF